MLRRCRAGYWQQTLFLPYIAEVLLHIHSWSVWPQSHPLQHGHTRYTQGSHNLQSPYSDSHWLDLRKSCEDKQHELLQTAVHYNRSFVTSHVHTIAVLPHVAAGATCCITLWPNAGAVLCCHIFLPHTLQCIHFAHIQKDRFSTYSSCGTQLQRWTGRWAQSTKNTVNQYH